MKVWIAYTKRAYEGCSEPLRAFATKELATVFEEGSKADYQSGVEIIELEVFQLPTKEEV